jgi:hypothetical protein
MSDEWITTFYEDQDGFPKVLHDATTHLDIPERPEYVGREFMECGTEYCEVTVYVGASEKYLEMKPWSVTTMGHRLKDTYQLSACKALRYLCLIFEWQLGCTPMKYFPPLDRNHPAWAARIRNLGTWGLAASEKDPTVVAMSGYLLSLDDLCDMLRERLRVLTQRAAETRWRKAKVTLAMAEARAAEAECRIVLAEEKLREQADRHSQLLREMHMTERAKHKDRQHENTGESPILDGIPLYPCLPPRKRLLGSLPPTAAASPRSSDTEDPEDRVVGPSQPAGPADS